MGESLNLVQMAIVCLPNIFFQLFSHMAEVTKFHIFSVHVHCMFCKPLCSIILLNKYYIFVIIRKCILCIVFYIIYRIQGICSLRLLESRAMEWRINFHHLA